MSHCPYLESNDLPKKKALVSLALSIGLLLAVALIKEQSNEDQEQRPEEIKSPAKHQSSPGAREVQPERRVAQMEQRPGD